MTNPRMSEADVTKGICSVEDCERPVLAKGYCSRHYAKNRKYGDPLYVVAYQSGTPCKAPKCERPRRRYGYCSLHSQRFVKYGTHELPERERPRCAGPECTNTLDPIQHQSGLCKSHYKQQQLGKPLTPLKVATRDLGRPETCEVAGCDRPHKARGLCKAHNERLAAGKDVEVPIQPRRPPGPCSLDGCDGARFANDLCARHNYSLVTRWRFYGITREVALMMYESQGGGCAICREPLPLHEMHVDHDHDCCPRGSCGPCVRGLLCGRCNLGLGQFRDDVARLRAAADYLER